jgi:intraflagellar transport protein 172
MSPDDVYSKEIEGEVVGISRNGPKTTVSLLSAGKITPFPLDGAFIAFSAAMEAGKLREAAQTLIGLASGNNFKSLWAELAEASMMAHDYVIAEVSFSNKGDLSRARFLHKLNKLISENGMDNTVVQARIAMLQSNFKQAECLLIEQDQLDFAIQIYKSMHMWHELLDLVELRCPNRAPQLRDEYFQHLLETNQYQVAAKLKAARREVDKAIDLCLQGDKPQLAAEILLSAAGDTIRPQLLAHVAEALVRANRLGIAGQVYERLGKSADALEAYRKGHAFCRALELAKAASPETVIVIEKEWADYLVSQGQNDAATTHYIESGDYSLALNCSLRAQQWQQAADILRSAASTATLRDQLRVQYMRVARHFASNNDAATAEDLFLAVGAHKELIEMYLTLGRIDEAVRHAKRNLKTADMELLFIDTARKMEKKVQARPIAEQIYISVNGSDLAVEMYRSANDTANVMRLTQQFGGDKAQLAVMAAQAEKAGDLADAERCYIQADQWEKALFMYEQEKKWQHAHRIAKTHGTQTNEVQTAVHWAVAIGGAAGVQKLMQLKLIEPALLYACENTLADLAQLIMSEYKNLSKTRLQQARMRFAVSLEI